MIVISKISLFLLLLGIFLIGLGSGSLLTHPSNKTIITYNITNINLPDQSIINQELPKYQFLSFIPTVNYIVVIATNLTPYTQYQILILPDQVPKTLFAKYNNETFLFYYYDLTVRWYLALLYNESHLIEQMLITL